MEYTYASAHVFTKGDGTSPVTTLTPAQVKTFGVKTLAGWEQDYGAEPREWVDVVNSDGITRYYRTPVLPTEVYYADCDQFDGHATGYYSTPEEAVKAFWDESHFSENDAKRAKPYARKTTVNEDTLVNAREWAAKGSPSPALFIKAV
jgi:hypothetical protein